MEASRTKRTTLQNTTFKRSQSPSGRFCSSTMSTSSSSSTTPIPERNKSYSILTRSTSPTRVTLNRSVSPSPTFKFAVSSTKQTKQQISSNSNSYKGHRSLNSSKRTCMCSPTTHPGSFRCSLHKNSNISSSSNGSSRSSHQLNMRRSAMTNSLVRIGTVEGELVKRALAALIRPSSHNLRRRGDFMPRPSRLSRMSKAEENVL